MNIQYRYAADIKGNIIDINELTPDNLNRETVFQCLSCKLPLMPKLGHFRQYHFSHKIQHACSRETYLHKLAKAVFMAEYIGCLKSQQPYKISILQSIKCRTCMDDLNICCVKRSEQYYNLTKYYDNIGEEVLDGQFRPDVLLRGADGSEKIYIEFTVSHKSEKEKLDSGIKVIDITIESEADIDILKNHHFRPDGNKIKFFNFKKTLNVRYDRRSKDCFGGRYYWFTVFNDKTTKFEELTVRDYFSKPYSNRVHFRCLSNVDVRFQTWKRARGMLILEALKAGYEVALINCPVCNQKLRDDIMKNNLWCSWCGRPVSELNIPLQEGLG